jgi:hypothetical protein
MVVEGWSAWTVREMEEDSDWARAERGRRRESVRTSRGRRGTLILLMAYREENIRHFPKRAAEAGV